TVPTVTGSRDFFVPFHISVELTRRCNLSCSYCYASANPADPDQELSGGELIEILSEWIAHGLNGIEITGGEPLLHKDFWKVLDFCLDNLSSVALLSNGTLIADAVADRLAQHREKLMLSISLDGSSAQMHDKVSGIPGSFEKTARALRAMVRRGLRVRVAMTVTPDNWREIEPTLLLAKDMGATWFGWAPLMPFGRGCNVKWDLTCQEVIELGEKEVQLMESYRGFVPAVPNVTRFQPVSWNCGVGWKNVVVGPSGLVRPCLVFPESSFSFADLKKEHIPKCFAKPILSRLRELPSPSEDICSDCELRIYCTTCPARALSSMKARSGKCSWVHATKSEDLVEMMRVA
ncbi:MAG: radical SAM/SPASM domain-containing protein, partial [bacterium]